MSKIKLPSQELAGATAEFLSLAQFLTGGDPDLQAAPDIGKPGGQQPAPVLLSRMGFPGPRMGASTLEITAKSKTCPMNRGHWRTRGRGEREEGGEGRKETLWCGLRRDRDPQVPGAQRRGPR